MTFIYKSNNQENCYISIVYKSNKFCNFGIDLTLSFLFILRNKKRYAYLVNWKRRKFRNYVQGRHSGSHA